MDSANKTVFDEKRYATFLYTLHKSFSSITLYSVTIQQIYEVDIIFLSLLRFGNWNSDFKCFSQERKLAIFLFKYFVLFPSCHICPPLINQYFQNHWVSMCTLNGTSNSLQFHSFYFFPFHFLVVPHVCV